MDAKRKSLHSIILTLPFLWLNLASIAGADSGERSADFWWGILGRMKLVHWIIVGLVFPIVSFLFKKRKKIKPWLFTAGRYVKYLFHLFVLCFRDPEKKFNILKAEEFPERRYLDSSEIKNLLVKPEISAIQITNQHMAVYAENFGIRKLFQRGHFELSDSLCCHLRFDVGNFLIGDHLREADVYNILDTKILGECGDKGLHHVVYLQREENSNSSFISVIARKLGCTAQPIFPKKSEDIGVRPNQNVLLIEPMTHDDGFLKDAINHFLMDRKVNKLYITTFFGIEGISHDWEVLLGEFKLEESQRPTIYPPILSLDLKVIKRHDCPKCHLNEEPEPYYRTRR